MWSPSKSFLVFSIISLPFFRDIHPLKILSLTKGLFIKINRKKRGLKRGKRREPFFIPFEDIRRIGVGRIGIGGVEEEREE